MLKDTTLLNMRRRRHFGVSIMGATVVNKLNRKSADRFIEKTSVMNICDESMKGKIKEIETTNGF